MARWSRWSLGISGALALAAALRVYLVSPELVPVHYGPTGIPDRWGSPLEVLVVVGCVVGLSTGLFLALPELVRRGPRSLINLPNKEYWLSPEHRDAATAKFAQWADVLGTSVNVLMLTLQLLLAPNQDGGASSANHLLPFVMVGFASFTLGSCVWLALSFRLPERAK